MSSMAFNPVTTVNNHDSNGIPAKANSKSTVHHSEPNAALRETLDQFRTALMTHLYDLVAPLYAHHANAKPGFYANDHTRSHRWHSTFDDGLDEKRIHPFVDMWETRSDYFAEIEMPGFDNKKSIAVHWTSPRTILVEATIPAPPGESSDVKTYNTKVDAGDKSGEDKRTWIANERRSGKLARILMFTTDVDMEALQAHLEAGLLKIKVPKRSSDFEGWKIEVL